MKSEQVLARRLAAAGIVSLLLFAGCGGGASPSSINPPPSGASNPNPTITTISPNSAVAGSAAFTLVINGTNFIAASTVHFGGSVRATTFVNSTQLTAAIPASSIASYGTQFVTVSNPAPGGGISGAVDFTITSAGPKPPTINSLFPSCVPAGEQFVGQVNNQLTVVGSNFAASSVVLWNGANRPTTFENDSGGILTAQISASDIAAAGTAAVTVFNPGAGGGNSNSLTFTITPGGVAPRAIAVDSAGTFAYVANEGCNVEAGGYVSMYRINPTSGALASIGPPVYSQDFLAYSVAVDPSGKFAYVANLGDDYSSAGGVAMYSINATTGALTSMGETIATCVGLCVPVSVVVDPSGKFAYAANAVVASLSMFTINGTTGALTSIGTIAAGTEPAIMAVNPAGTFAYLANFGSNDVSMYTIDATTGALTSIGTIAAGTGPVSVTVDPAGKFAYVANSGSNDVSMYTIDATTGALASIGTIATGTGPVSIAVDPASKFAYAANLSSNDVSMYTINATTGALTLIGTIAAGSNPSSIAIHPSGKFAYVTNYSSNDVSMYGIDSATGTLTLIGTIGT